MEFQMKPVQRIAEDVHQLPFHGNIPGGILCINPLVIMAREPVLVDTGVKWLREQYLRAVFSIVEPRDVKWIFLSHDDGDHAGNLMEVWEQCPNAKLVTNFVGVGRLSEQHELPMTKLVWINDGESFDVGDRKLTCLRPPFFDSPATRGLWDPKNELYYSVDSFGALLKTGWYPEVSEVPADDYQQGFDFWNRWNHPWHQLVDPAKMEKHLSRIRALSPKVLAGYHGPVSRTRNDQLFKMIADISTMDPLVEWGQKELEGMLAAMQGQG